MVRLPFELTSQIRRYLKELSDFYDDFYVKETGKIFILRTYKDEEKPTDRSENNIFDFVDYFQENGALDASGKSPSAKIPAGENNLDHDFYYVEYYTLKILDIKPVRALLKKIGGKLENKEEKQNIPSDAERLISMDGEGDFKIGKFRDFVPFKSKKAGYYRVFVAIYKLTNGVGGRVPYKQVSEYIKKHFGEKELSTKDIQNHINNSLKRRYLPKRTPDGEDIISADSEGKELLFYNPVIE